MTQVNWWRVADQSLAVAVRNCGFDLTVFPDYPKAVQTQIKSSARRAAMSLLCDEFEDVAGKPLQSVKYGVYVISVSSPFTISYSHAHSNVVYIGRGNIYKRINSHFKKSLFAFMESLAGANFDFHFCEPTRRGPGGPNFYKHIEHLLLESFRDTIGGGKLPLLNRNRANGYSFPTPVRGWNKPLKNTGQRPVWALKVHRKDFRSSPLD